MRVACLATVVMVALVVANPTARAAESSACSPALCTGAHALQFEIGYDFKLSPFQGATLSYERFLRDRLALRLGIGASMMYEDDERAVDFEGDTEARGEIDLTNWYHQYSLVCQLVSYQGGPVALYYGAGPKVTYSNERQERVWFSGYGEVLESHGSIWWRRAWGVGVAGVAGVQWLVSDRFALHAEYSTALMYRHDDETLTSVMSGENYRVMKETDERSAVGVYPDGTRLGLSVFF